MRDTWITSSTPWSQIRWTSYLLSSYRWEWEFIEMTSLGQKASNTDYAKFSESAWLCSHQHCLRVPTLPSPCQPPHGSTFLMFAILMSIKQYATIVLISTTDYLWILAYLLLIIWVFPNEPHNFLKSWILFIYNLLFVTHLHILDIFPCQ